MGLEEEIVPDIRNIGTANQTDFRGFCVSSNGEVELLGDFGSGFISNRQGDGVDAELSCSRSPRRRPRASIAIPRDWELGSIA